MARYNRIFRFLRFPAGAYRSGLAGLCLSSALLLGQSVTPAQACQRQIRITYAESSPDVFHIQFLKGQGLELRSIAIDLAPSKGKALVDTLYGATKTNDTRGVILRKIDGFAEGERAGALHFANFGPGKRISVLIDLDAETPADGSGGDHLTGADMADAKVRATLRGSGRRALTLTGKFNGRGIADLGGGACV